MSPEELAVLASAPSMLAAAVRRHVTGLAREHDADTVAAAITFAADGPDLASFVTRLREIRELLDLRDVRPLN